MSEKYNQQKDPNPKITEEVVEKLLNDTNYTKQQLKNIALLLFSRINNDSPDEYNQENDPYPRTTHHAVFELWDDENMEMNKKIALLLLKSVAEGALHLNLNILDMFQKVRSSTRLALPKEFGTIWKLCQGERTLPCYYGNL